MLKHLSHSHPCGGFLINATLKFDDAPNGQTGNRPNLYFIQLDRFEFIKQAIQSKERKSILTSMTSPSP